MYSSRTKTSVNAEGNKADESSNFLLKGWLPVNRKHFNQVKEKLGNHSYDKNRPEFIFDLKSDLALFGYFLKKVKQLSDVSSDRHDFTTLCDSVSNPDLLKLLQVSESEISPHHLWRADQYQIQCYTHVMLACALAESMALKISLNPTNAYLNCYLLQVPYLLVAWNYPKLYANAITNARAGKNAFETEIEKTLNSTRQVMAEKLATTWHMLPWLKEALKTPGQNDDGSPSLSRVCRLAGKIGWMFDVDRKIHLEDKNRDLAYLALAPYFNEKVSEEILEDSKELATGYLSPLSRINFVRVKEDIVPRDFMKDYPLNKYVDDCPYELRECFRSIYEEVTQNESSTNWMEILTKKVLPRGGFGDGYIFLLSKEEKIIEPLIALGDPDKSSSLFTNAGHQSLERALQSKEPIRFHLEAIDTPTYKLNEYISGIFDLEGNTVIVCLEVDFNSKFLKPENQMKYFPAIVQCVRDSISLTTHISSKAF